MADHPNAALAEVAALLEPLGWRLPDDPTAVEICLESTTRWGLPNFVAALGRRLALPEPSYSLEGFGAALGERWECPRQLVAVDPDTPSMVTSSHE